MKSVAASPLTLITVAALVAAASAQDACRPDQLVRLASFATNDYLHPCEAEAAGYKFVPPSGYPTHKQIAAMCASDKCHQLTLELRDAELDDCYFTWNEVSINPYKLATGFETFCKHQANSTDEQHEPDKPRGSRPGDHHSKPQPTPASTKYRPYEDDHHRYPPKHDDCHLGEYYSPTPYMTPAPTKHDSHHPRPTPTPTKYEDHHPTPTPTKYEDHHPTPTPTKYEDHHPTPTPTKYEDHHPTPTPTKYEDHHPTPTPTKYEDHHPTPTPTPTPTKHHYDAWNDWEKEHNSPTPTHDYEEYRTPCVTPAPTPRYTDEHDDSKRGPLPTEPGRV